MLKVIAWPEKIENETIAQAARRVHHWAHSIFAWTPDTQTWGAEDHVPTESDLEQLAREGGGVIHDDCDGFMALCRYALWRLGIPNRGMRCNVEPDAAPPSYAGNHAVCTPAGTDLVLDNRYAVVMTRAELERIGYQFISMSGLLPGEPWTAVRA